ncbi:MAG: T9SS type A sorting domain-containing protein, partial [Bacteroidetes bacterium]|nr:T9SS type A sorting domain-containing protein [Bacteroidota bacterium]
QTTVGSNYAFDIVVDARKIKGITANGRLYSESGVLIAETPLFDDGSHKDGIAGDRIFGGSVTVAPQSEAMYLNSVITDESNAIYEWNKLRSFITTAPITVESPIVLSDNANNDGKANKGETVRFSIPFVNPNPFTLASLKVTVLVNGTTMAGQLTIPLLQPNGRFDPVYNAADPSSYCTVVIPGSYPGTTVPISLFITDSTANAWKRELALTVHTPVNDRVGMKRRAGKSSIVPTITVIDNKAYLEHYYIVQGVDSVGIGGTPGFRMKDSTTGSQILNTTILNTETIAGFGIPVVNGLKLHWSGEYHPSVSVRSLVYTSVDSTRFPGFKRDYMGYVPINTYIQSNLPLTDYRDIKIRFSQRTSLDDRNGNGRFDPGELYTFDSTNTQRSQRAYFYRRETLVPPVWSFRGFISIPFAVYAIESNSPRQLDVVFMDNGKMNRWDFSDTLPQIESYIMASTYDPTGTRYDSTKGGLNLIPVINGKQKHPIYLVNRVKAGEGDPLAIEGDCDILLTRPLTSQDEFIIGPGDFVTSVPSTTIPAEYRLYQNYPNPFNPVTTIRYSTQNAAHASVRVYNVLGQLVKVLADRPHSAGEHVVEWDGTNTQQRSVPSGVYFYRLESGSFSEVRKMLLLK